jgi:hypothetical protein
MNKIILIKTGVNKILGQTAKKYLKFVVLVPLEVDER